MNVKVFLFVLVAAFAVIGIVQAAPQPGNFFEDLGRRFRDGIIKAGPAVAVVGQAVDIARPQNFT